MSWLKASVSLDKQSNPMDQLSVYQPDDKTKEMIALVRKHFTDSDVIMQQPRREFDDLSVIGRMTVDEMGFNTYQPNNGDPLEGDEMNAWRSRAIRPVIRNKVVSIAAHATAKLIFPKLFSYSKQSIEQKDAAFVMETLMEWAADRSNYRKTQFYATIQSLVHPVSIIHTEYCETFRKVKREKNEDGTYKIEEILDEDLSGFQDTIIPCDQFYIENFYEKDMQRQGHLIWRRIMSYSLAEALHSNKYPDTWKYVRPGIQVLYNSPNQSFYDVYDTDQTGEMVEVVDYWNKSKDVKLCIVNGVMLTDPENPNPRNDKLYPFTKMGYEVIGDGNCFYYKSLAFKMSKDANIINTLYPMIIDGTYLNLMPPMVNVGGETITADVIVPGAVTTLSDPKADLRAIRLSENLTAGMNTLFKVDESITQSSQEPILAGQAGGGSKTAYEISKIEQNAATVLGLYMQIKGFAVAEFGKLRIGDILQYLTLADVSKITDNPELVFKTFILPNKQSKGRIRTRKISFTTDMPEEPTEREKLEQSYKTLEKEGGVDGDEELYEVNPALFRDLQFMLSCSPDVLSPMSEDVERAFALELYDRAIANPLANQEEVYKDFLLSVYPKAKENVDKYINKPQEQAPQPPVPEMAGAGMVPSVPEAPPM